MPELRAGHVLNTMGHGGVPRVAYELLERLPASVDRVLYCLSARTRDPAARDRLVERLGEHGVRVRFADATGARAAGEQVGRWIAEDGIDLVHTHSTKPNRYARAAVLRHADVRLVAHYHNTYDDKWADPQVLDDERRLARATDRLVACSDAVRDHLVHRLEVPREQVEVVPNGVQPDDFRGDGRRLRAELGLAADVPLVGTVGRISRQKAPEDFLLAARRVLDREPRAVFLLVGETDDAALSAQVRSLAQDLQLGDRLRLLGHRTDVADVYDALDVFVLPSRWEGFGLVLVEAMASGTPVVATDVGGIPQVTGALGPGEGCALLVPPGRPDALAEAVCRVLAEPGTARAMVVRGRARALRFGWQDAADAVCRLYGSLLARSPVEAR